MEYFELLITPEIAKFVSRETNCYTKQFFFSKYSCSKLSSEVQHWNALNKGGIMNVTRRITRTVFPGGRILETFIFL
jgi:hypothetical protein